MIEFRKVKLHKLAIHKVGNKSLEEGIELSEEWIPGDDLDDVLLATLLKYFLKPFEDLPPYCFSHSVELEMNEAYKVVQKMFHTSNRFLENSQDFAKLLYEVSRHPKIKGGELYIAFFQDCIYEDNLVDAIGIFKSETVDTFLQVKHQRQAAHISAHEGINTDKLDKGCLILNKKEKEGFQVHILDHANKGEEAMFWKNDFLQLRAQNDNYHFTTNLLQLTKQYVLSSLPDEFEVKKADQIDYLNRSVDYFKENENFNIGEFEKQVFKDPEMIQSYRQFGSQYVTQHDVDIAESFEISTPALKRQTRFFKSVIKLDRNFHIYIHGNRDMIEQGVDEETGRKYYKIYFDKEA